MIDYIFKVILCSGFFITIYYVFLQNEKMHQFNRFYLIISGLFSFIIPALKFKRENSTLEHIEDFVFQGTLYVNNTIETLVITSPEKFSWDMGMILIYSIVASVLLTRFIFLNRIISNKIKQCELIPLDKATIVLTDDSQLPHSYRDYFFVPKSDYKKGMIDQSIIDHELAHINQKHTFDIWLVEFLIIILWFNPFLYLYRSAIRLNHEFLADEAVISQHKNSIHYKHLILRKTADANGLAMNQSLSCSFNYIKTKKRLEMMTKQKITWRNIVMQCSLGPILLIAIVLFSDNTIAQEVKNIVAQAEILPTQTQTNSEEELQKSFDELLKPYIKEKNGKPVYYGIDSATQKKLIPLYEKMSESQKARQIVKYMPGLKKRVPAEVEFEKWKDPRMYGVWLDGKRISNDLLNGYNNTDISNYNKSRLAKNAINYGKHVYQLNARTNKNFEAYNKRLKEEPYLVFRRPWETN